MPSSTQTALWFMNTRVRIVVSADDAPDGLSVLRHWAPYGDSPPLHVHDNEDEVFHIISGQVRFTIDGQIVEASAGDTLVAPKGVPHTYCVDSAEGARFLTVTAHRDFEAMVREAARPATAPGLPEPVDHPTPEMIEAITRICAKHSIRLIGAPLQPKIAA